MTAPQMSLDFDAGARARDHAHGDVLAHLGPHVVEAITFEIVSVVRSAKNHEATSDDVFDALSDTTKARLAELPNAMGAIFRKLALQRLIIDTGKVVRSRRASARKRKIAVWRAP